MKAPDKAEGGLILAGCVLGVLLGVVRTQLPGLWPFGTPLSVASVQPSRSTAGANKHPAYRVTLYANGALDGGMEAELPAGLCDSKDVASKLAAWAWVARTSSGDFSGGGGNNEPPCNGCTLYDATARRIERCADLRHTSTSDAHSPASKVDLWVVPSGKWFVYPTGNLGRAMPISRVPPPKGAKFPITVETISHSPRVFHLHNFLTEAESDALIDYALNNKDPILGLQRSTTGAEHQVSFNQMRTSENAFDATSPTSVALQKRAAAVLGMAPFDSEMMDGLQVLRYNASKAYIPHVDYLDDNNGGHDFDSSQQGSNRFATIFFYLSDVEEGGETVFPLGAAVDDGEVNKLDGVRLRPSPPFASGAASQQEVAAATVKALRDGSYYDLDNRRANNGSLYSPGVRPLADPLASLPSKSWQETMVGQCKSALAVRPKKAHAVLFYSQRPDGSLDPMSKHGGCPVGAGVKWAANLWVWNRVRLGYARAPRKAGAAAYDSTAGIGRDRMAKQKQSGGGGDVATTGAAADAPTQATVSFVNNGVPGAKLYYNDDVFMGALEAGSAGLRFNTYEGHQWTIKDATGATIGRYTVDARPEQEYRVGSQGSSKKRPSSAPRLPPGARPPN